MHQPLGNTMASGTRVAGKDGEMYHSLPRGDDRASLLIKTLYFQEKKEAPAARNKERQPFFATLLEDF